MLPSDDLVALAHRLADRAGEVVRPFFRRGITAEDKADGSQVTLADRAVEEALRALLAEAVPDHGVIGEELGTSGAGAELVWILDPIDGTRAFVTGKPLFTTLIALAHRGRPVLGVIDQPITGDRWVGAAGRATLFGRPGGTVDPPARVRLAGRGAALQHGAAVLQRGAAAGVRARLRASVVHELGRGRVSVRPGRVRRRRSGHRVGAQAPRLVGAGAGRRGRGRRDHGLEGAPSGHGGRR